MKQCITCGKEHTMKGMCCESRSCQVSSNVISQHLIVGSLITFEYVRKFFIQHEELTARKFKEILATNQDYLYSMYQHINWTTDYQEIRYCIIENITSQPKCEICQTPVKFLKCLLKHSNDTRYRKYCQKHNTVNMSKNFLSKRIDKINDETIIPLNELLNKLEKYKDKQLDKISNAMIFEGLLSSIKHYTKFIDDTVKRKISLSERLICLWNNITELPKCSVCGEYGVKYTRAIKSHMEWCSHTCLKKISVLRNKTPEEIDIINVKKRTTWKNKSTDEMDAIRNKCINTWKTKTQEDKNNIKAKCLTTWKNNSTIKRIYSTISQELFFKIYNKLELKDDVYFGMLNEEKPIKTKLGIRRVDFCKGNKIIEFNGDNVHATPYKYRPLDKYNYYRNSHMTVEDKWESDFIRTNSLIEKGYQVLIIWSSDYVRDKEAVVEKCLKFLEN